jgi:pilus assembly protein CpaF
VSAVDTVEAEVRELVRRRGLDPVTDKRAMRLLVDEVVAEYDARTLTSALPPLTDAAGATRVVYDAVAGFGPLQRHLDDPTVEEIWINERLTHGLDERLSPGRGSSRAASALLAYERTGAGAITA